MNPLSAQNDGKKRCLGTIPKTKRRSALRTAAYRVKCMSEYYINRDKEGIVSKTDVDLDLIDEVPDESRTWLLWLFVKIKSPDESGWCLEHEDETMLRLRREAEALFAGELDARLSGVRMAEGWVELFFYAPTAKKLQNCASSLMKAYGGYAFETGSSRDPKWEHYLNVLYPDALMMQQIQSRYIIAELEDAGDDIAMERPVEHYLFFKTSAHADRTAEKLEAEGYALKETVEAEGEYTHGIVLVKTHDVSEEKLFELTSVLVAAAEAEHGIYEGWSTVLA